MCFCFQKQRSTSETRSTKAMCFRLCMERLSYLGILLDSGRELLGVSRIQEQLPDPGLHVDEHDLLAGIDGRLNLQDVCEVELLGTGQLHGHQARVGWNVIPSSQAARGALSSTLLASHEHWRRAVMAVAAFSSTVFLL